MIQGGQASLIGCPQLVGPTANSSNGVIPSNIGNPPGGGDVHICGSCNLQFHDIKIFLAHKRQGCQHVHPPQQSPQPASQPLQLAGVGVPVGMPHVILQTSSGVPQMYRLVLEPSVQSNPAPPTSSRIMLEPTISTSQAIPCTPHSHVEQNSSSNHVSQISSSNHLSQISSVLSNTFINPTSQASSTVINATSQATTIVPNATSQTTNAAPNSLPQEVKLSQSSIQSTPILTQALASIQNQNNVMDSTSKPQPSSSETSATESLNETEPQVRNREPSQSDQQITAPCVSISTEASGATIITTSVQQHLSHKDTDVSVGRSSSITETSNSVYELPQVSWTSDSTNDKVNNRERLSLSDSSLHTEEEDVATFLATQLASQAGAIQGSLADLNRNKHSEEVNEQIQPSILNSEQQKSPLQFASASTQSTHHLSHGIIDHKQKHIQPHFQIDNNEHINLIKQHHIENNHQGSFKSSQRFPQVNTNIIEYRTDPPTKSPKTNNVRMQEVDRKKEKVCPMKGCNFSTCHNKDLSRHIRTHTGEKPYHCIICEKSFTRGDKLKVHMRIHNNVRPYWCQEPGCQYRAIDSGSLKKHMRIHSDERPYKCQLCLYSARDGSQLTVHLRTHTGDTPFQCMVENCSAAFKTSSDLRRHERLHTGVKPYKCSECDYACAIKSNLTVHVRLNHFQGAKFSCGRCDFVANNRKQLKDHEKSHSETLLHCEICQHITTSTTSLRQHMLLHSQEKPFQCRYCSFTCKTTGNLRYHVRNKHGCDVSKMSKKASVPILPNNPSSNKIRSSLSNTNGRKSSRPNCYRSFKCNECGSGFVREDSYRSHVRQHEKYKMSHTIGKMKMNNEMLSVVVQDGIVMGSSEGDGEMEFQTIESSKESLHTERIHESQSIVDNSSIISESNNVDSYNSYVITIDGISTVFSNPVRISSENVTNHSGQDLSGTVQVITGNLTTLNQATNKESNSEHYPLTDEDKFSSADNLYSKMIKQVSNYDEKIEQQIANSSNEDLIKPPILDSNSTVVGDS